jgi:hypothetical protein
MPWRILMAKEPFIMESTDFVGVEFYEGLPILVASTDFFEFLQEQGYEDTIEADELCFEIQDYIRTECEKI